MEQFQIKTWLEYWQKSDEVAVNEIKSFEDVAIARKHCLVMRIGLFSPDIIDYVSNREIWDAIVELRK